MIVRPERTDDHSQIAELVGAAFGSPVEPRLVEALRASDGYLPELALVADDGVVGGHVMFTVTELEDGTAILMLSPLAVLPPRQRQGVGSALVHEGLLRAAARDEPLVIVEGDPRYYSRFGFTRASELRLEPPNEGVPEHAFQALRLPAYDGSVCGPRPLPAAVRRLVTDCYLTTEAPARRLGRGRASAAQRSSATNARAISRAGFRRSLRIRRMSISCSSADRPILCRQNPRLHLEK